MIQGKLIKKYREENNLTIKDLSKLMHVSKNVITLWEDGTKIPREDDITFLCSLYGIDRIDLMNTTDNKISKKNSKKRNTKHRNIIVSIIMIFISVILGFIFNVILGVVLGFGILTMYNSLYYLKDERLLSKNARGPKTIFGISLSNKEKTTLVKYYFLESLAISSIYLLLSLFAYELNIEPLIINVTIFTNEVTNMLFIWGTLFIALTALLLAIEIIFASILMKKER